MDARNEKTQPPPQDISFEHHSFNIKRSSFVTSLQLRRTVIWYHPCEFSFVLTLTQSCLPSPPHISTQSSNRTYWTMNTCYQQVTHCHSNHTTLYLLFLFYKHPVSLHSHRRWWSFPLTFPRVRRSWSSLRPRQRTSTRPQSEFIYQWSLIIGTSTA